MSVKIGRIWFPADETARDALGSDLALRVGDSAILISDGALHRCATVAGASSSTWTPSAGADTAVKLVRAASTANVSLATGLENGDAVDGVTLATGNRVLLKNQTAPAENGIYTVVASGAASRSSEFATAAQVLPGVLVSIAEGTANKDTVYQHTTDAPITVDTTALTFAQVGGGSVETLTQTLAAGDETGDKNVVVSFTNRGLKGKDQTSGDGITLRIEGSQGQADAGDGGQIGILALAGQAASTADTAGGIGGKITDDTGIGGAGIGTGAGGAGGALPRTCGAGGVGGATGAGGDGGDIDDRPGAGGAGGATSGNGGAGGTYSGLAGAGGAAGGSGNGGTGGSNQWGAGGGGAAAGAAGVGGSAGTHTVFGSTGGAGSGGGAGGVGSGVNHAGGTGGAGNGAGLGGAGGTSTRAMGTGGAGGATGGGGAGGALVDQAGDGGLGGATSGAGGAGGTASNRGGDGGDAATEGLGGAGGDWNEGAGSGGDSATATAQSQAGGPPGVTRLIGADAGAFTGTAGRQGGNVELISGIGQDSEGAVDGDVVFRSGGTAGTVHWRFVGSDFDLIPETDNDVDIGTAAKKVSTAFILSQGSQVIGDADATWDGSRFVSIDEPASGTNTITVPDGLPLGTLIHVYVTNNASGNAQITGAVSETFSGSAPFNFPPGPSVFLIYKHTSSDWILTEDATV